MTDIHGYSHVGREVLSSGSSNGGDQTVVEAKESFDVHNLDEKNRYLSVTHMPCSVRIC